MQKRVMKTPNIEVLWEHQAIDLFEKTELKEWYWSGKGNAGGGDMKIPIDGFFPR